jgi:hypothetical protein
MNDTILPIALPSIFQSRTQKKNKVRRIGGKRRTRPQPSLFGSTCVCVCWLIDPHRQKVYPFSFLLLHLPFIFTCVSTCTTEEERCCMRPVHVDWVRDAGGLWSAEEEKEKWEVDVVNRRKGPRVFSHFVARFPFTVRERRIRSCVYFGAP